MTREADEKVMKGLTERSLSHSKACRSVMVVFLSTESDGWRSIKMDAYCYYHQIFVFKCGNRGTTTVPVRPLLHGRSPR